MNRTMTAAALMCWLSTAALAQNSTATGVGVGQSESNSAAGAVAINKGNGNSNSSLTINNPASTTSAITSRTEVSGTQTLKNVPTAFAPSLAAAGIETCLGSVSGGGSIVGFGGSFGTTIPDPGCQARLDARTLWSMGLKGAAVARLCIREDIYRSMPDVCEKYRPAGAVYPVVAPVVPVVVPDYGYAPARVASGPIEVVNGKTGKIGLCDNYDEAGQKCRQWAGAPPVAKRTATGRPIILARKQTAIEAINAAAPTAATVP
jgi:hypothetical protein